MAPNIQLSFGPMLIGTFVNMILYGILIMQTYHYYLTYKSDPKWIKTLVYYLFIVESLNTACDIQMMYQPLIQHFGEAEATKFFPMMFAAEPIVIVAVSTPIQFFFAWRVRLLTKSNWLAFVICFFSIVSMAGGIWTTVLIVKVKLFSRKEEMHWSALVWFLAACVADIIITVVLVITLSRRKTGFSATDDAIQKIIRMTVQTGALTALFAVGDVVFFMSLGRTALNFLWDLALSKLYANCLLSTLNARATIKESTQGSNPRQSNQGNRRGGTGSGVEGAYNIPPLASHLASSANTHYSEFELDEAGITNLNRSATGSVFGEKRSQSDLEYGITVTKVVETLEDPRPAATIRTASHSHSHCSEYIAIPSVYKLDTSSSISPQQLAFPQATTTNPAMDSFATISLTSDKAPATVKIPTNAEDPGQGGGTYCVVFARDLPVDNEDPNGQGGGTYCTIA
ncbi:hypothetical protein FA13DRAFT_1794514 [Coprinellus micaceus]|uniref:DUF6534 domain-containing protein n=1 Tax=Coprinellus micaceus TaxID=71717 RepID=A0A4Y7T2K4_COPMI|nr:hypothetical protein FA13DRAFT_1794514 [Coprinellus micaceus]